MEKYSEPIFEKKVCLLIKRELLNKELNDKARKEIKEYEKQEEWRLRCDGAIFGIWITFIFMTISFIIANILI